MVHGNATAWWQCGVFSGGEAELVGTFSDGVEVIQSATGAPLHLILQGVRYTLAATPLRWFERRKWWEEVSRVAPGSGAGLVEQEVWRVEMRRDDQPQAPLQSFDLVKYLPGERWRVLKVHEALISCSSQDLAGNKSPGSAPEISAVTTPWRRGRGNG